MYIRHYIRLQDAGNGLIALSFHSHTKNAAYHLCCLRVDDPLLLVIRGFLIAKGRLGQRLAQVAPDTVGGTHLAADVPRIHLVHHVAERRKLVFSLVAVHHIVYCNETHISIWEITVSVIADRDIVSVVQHGLEAGAVEVCAGIAIVYIELCVAQAQFSGLLGQKPFLVCDGVAVAVRAVIPGEPAVQGGDPHWFCFLFRLHV